MEQPEEKRRRQSPLPIDLTIEILLRLPEKSVVRFRCVSKLWLSISTDQYFINLFETRSPRPSLLLCFRKDGNVYVSSIPQDTHTLHSNKPYSSSQPIESYHMKFPEEYNKVPLPTESVHGLICFQTPENPIIWNPSKRQFLTLPRPRKSWKDLKVFLGYDPVEGKHKVMCMPLNRSCDVSRVFTLGSAQNSWRTVKTNHKHRCELRTTNGRCIEGVIYYVAYIHQTNNWVVMSFDVRSEKFDTIKLPCRHRGNLMTYQGKLACVNDGVTSLWILEDAKKHEWSIRDNISHLSPDTEHTPLVLRGSTHAGEFIYVTYVFSKSSCALFYDPFTNSFRRFEFKEIAEGQEIADGLQYPLYAFPNHIESQISLL